MYGKLGFYRVNLYKNPSILGFIKMQHPNQSYHAFGTLMMDGHVWWFGDWIDFLGFMTYEPKP